MSAAITYGVVWHAVPSTQEYPSMALTAMGPQISADTVVERSGGSVYRVDYRLMPTTCDFHACQWAQNEIEAEDLEGGNTQEAMRREFRDTGFMQMTKARVKKVLRYVKANRTGNRGRNTGKIDVGSGDPIESVVFG